MSDNGKRQALVDTSFLITLYDSSRKNHKVAKKYYKYFLKNKIQLRLSTIVISEFQQMQPIIDIINTGHYIVLPYNYEHSIKTAEIAYNLGGTDRRGDSNAKYKDDLKLMAQADVEEIDFIITDDESTLARYCHRLSEANLFDPKVITLGEGFDEAPFNDGQASLEV